MGNILNPAIYMFVKLKYQTCDSISLFYHQGNLQAIEHCHGLDNGVT